MHATSDAAPAHKTVFGQPRGLATLFLTEMWERFSYYGMRSILILYAVAAVSDGGFGLDDHVASAIYGLYIAATYVFALFGGWMADRLLGAQRAVIAAASSSCAATRCWSSGACSPSSSGLAGHRARRGSAQAQHQRHGGGALSGGRRAARCRASRSSTSASASGRFWARSSCRSPPRTSAGGGDSACRCSACCSASSQFMLTRRWLWPPRPRHSSGPQSWALGSRSVVLVLAVATVAALALSGRLIIDPVRLVDRGLLGDRAVRGRVTSPI